MLLAAALSLAACDRSAPPATEKGGAKPRSLGEIDEAVSQLKERNARLENAVRRLEQSAARWVLWQSAQPMQAASGFSSPQQPVDAFPDKDQCVEAAKEAVSGAQRALSRTGPMSYQAVDPDGILMQVTYTCLPETIDPRRPAPAR
ncbi:MAG: hypothetical protein KIT18_12820 [Burkholderiales bacterium]|nr:hypothetical protein [Burkholderiales bacterium]